MSKRKYVDVNVGWSNGSCSPTTRVPLKDWKRIVLGERIWTSASYWYEGQKSSASFAFNHAGRGTLRVGYGDGGVGFDGSIRSATITGGEFPEPFWCRRQEDTGVLTFGADISQGWRVDGFSPRPKQLRSTYCFREAIQLEWFKGVVKAELSVLPPRQAKDWMDPPALTIARQEPAAPADCCRIEASDGQLGVSVTLLSATGVRHPGFRIRHGRGDRLVFRRAFRSLVADGGRPGTVEVGLTLTLTPPTGWREPSVARGDYFSTCVSNWAALSE